MYLDARRVSELGLGALRVIVTTVPDGAAGRPDR
jgi:hypothetical protein